MSKLVGWLCRKFCRHEWETLGQYKITDCREARPQQWLLVCRCKKCGVIREVRT